MGRQATAWKYGSRGSGRGGGRDNGRNRNEKSNNRSTTKEKDMRFATQDQMTRGYYGTYNAVKELIITEVQKKYEYGCDIATAIRTGKRFDIKSVEPKRGISENKDENEKSHEQGGLDILYQEELRVHLDRKKISVKTKLKRTVLSLATTVLNL